MSNYPYFAITDGSTTCLFSDGAGGVTEFLVASDSWAPAVAQLRQSELGGRGPYEDALEELDIHITGNTAAVALANLAKLVRLLEQAERWLRGDTVTAVLAHYSPRAATVSSAASPLKATILGGKLTLPRTFDGPEFLRGHYIVRARLTFLRRGAWLHTEDTASSSAAANPGPFSISGMDSHPTPSPAKVALKNFTFGTHLDVADSLPLVLLARQASDLQIAEAEGGTTTAFTSVADSAAVARGGSVLRYTPAGTSEAASGQISLSSMTAAARRFAFFAAIRNNSASVSWRMRVAALVEARAATSSNLALAYTRPIQIDTAHARPRFVPLGEVSLPAALKSCQLLITAGSTSGSPTLDVDYVVALAVDNPYARALQLTNIGQGGLFNHIQPSDLIIDPQPLVAIAPVVYRTFQTTADRDWSGYYGDAFPLAAGTAFAAAIMGKRADATTCWTYAPVSGSAASLTLTIDRLKAYQVPQ